MYERRGGRPGAGAAPVLAALVLLGSLVAGVLVPPVGAQTAEVAADVVYDGSVDGVDGSVYRLYRAFFSREPDADGLVYWIVQARYGDFPIGSVSEHFARSDEFRNRYGTVSDDAFVDLVYRNVLGRAPDASGRAYWSDQLRRGMRRGHVMLYFSDSVEFARAAGAGPFGRRDHRGPARPAPSAPAGSYSFLDPAPDGGLPLSWARCRPVYVAVNPAGIPERERPELLEMLDHALDAVSAATGQDWVHVGRTAYRANDKNSHNHVPGLVSVSFMRAPDPEEAALGWANTLPGWNPVVGAPTYLSGSVNLNAQNLVTDFGGVTALVATTLMHELGHIAGLDHVDDQRQLMASAYELRSEPTLEAYRDGDLAGLAQVGSVTTAC